MRQSKSVFLGWLLYCFNPLAFSGSDPWFTGPLLAPSGHTIPAGHSNLETYAIHTDNRGIYNRHWKLTHAPGNSSTQANPLFSHGLTDYVDVQFSLPYVHNVNMGESSSGLSDNSAILGIQLLEQKQHRWRPDLRLSIQQIFPTGKFEQLDPQKKGTDAKGLGSYQTSIALNFQHLLPVMQTHYLRTRYSLNYIYAKDVKLHGLSSYGGTVNTQGKLDPGNLSSIDIAGEFTMTQHWVAVMEFLAAHRQATRFKGFKGMSNPDQTAVNIGHDVVDVISLAPAVEYNFNEHVGLIAGTWFILKGKDTTKFTSTMVALNAYW